MQTVVRATKSPMNAKQWCCDLECGHEQWVTSSRQPKRAVCDTCKPSRPSAADKGGVSDG